MALLPRPLTNRSLAALHVAVWLRWQTGIEPSC